VSVITEGNLLVSPINLRNIFEKSTFWSIYRLTETSSQKGISKYAEAQSHGLDPITINT